MITATLSPLPWQWVVIDTLADFRAFGYTSLEVLTPSQYAELPQYMQDKIVYVGDCSDCYDYKWGKK
jgi:hypothetical protein